ncbi:hypothetical protein V8C34DRAFT_291245 [Trichoderma compactum]
MEHPGRGSTSTWREDSDEAIIPFGVPSCCPFYRKPTLLYVMARGTVQYEIQHAARGCSVPLRRLTARPVAMSQSQCLGRCSARMRGRSYPWIFFPVGEGSTCGAESNRAGSTQRRNTPQEQGRQSGVEKANAGLGC